jgi:hypothetical protein
MEFSLEKHLFIARCMESTANTITKRLDKFEDKFRLPKGYVSRKRDIADLLHQFVLNYIRLMPDCDNFMEIIVKFVSLMWKLCKRLEDPLAFPLVKPGFIEAEFGDILKLVYCMLPTDTNLSSVSMESSKCDSLLNAIKRGSWVDFCRIVNDLDPEDIPILEKHLPDCMMQDISRYANKRQRV